MLFKDTARKDCVYVFGQFSTEDVDVVSVKVLRRLMGNKKKFDKILDEMEAVLDKLILNAEKLHEVSKLEITEEELDPLQSIQDELLSKLLKLDDVFEKAHLEAGLEYQSPAHTRIQAKLDTFQNLNASFINNIMTSRGLIRFEGRKISKTKKSR